MAGQQDILQQEHLHHKIPGDTTHPVHKVFKPTS
jgi:hypothetical protein